MANRLKALKELKKVLATSAFVAATLLGWQKANADTEDLKYNGETGNAAVTSLAKNLRENMVDCSLEKAATTILEYGQKLPDFLGTPLDVGTDFVEDQSLDIGGLPQWAKDEYAKYCAGARMDINRYREQLRNSGWLTADGKLDLTRCPEIVETILPGGGRAFLRGRKKDPITGYDDGVLGSLSYRVHQGLGRLLTLKDDNKRIIAMLRVDASGAHLTGENPSVVMGKQIIQMVILPKEQNYYAYVIIHDENDKVESYTQSPKISYEEGKEKVQQFDKTQETPAVVPAFDTKIKRKVPVNKLSPARG